MTSWVSTFSPFMHRDRYSTEAGAIGRANGYRHLMAPRRFPIRIGRRSRLLLRLFGVRDGHAYVDLNDELDARFGFFSVSTAVSNIASWRIEGPWLWITAIGVRTSIRHRDVTFGGSPHGGVRVDFKERVRFGFLRIPALYVTVEDLEGLAAALTARGIPGEDARKRRL
jgi:hypothetical protein